MHSGRSGDAFERAIAHVLEHEGPYVDHPADPGGSTNWGVSLRFLRDLGDTDGDGWLDGDLDHDGDVDAADIRALSREDAVRIYRAQWWDRYGYESLKEPVGAKLLDVAINCGQGQAVRLLQRALRSCGRVLKVDGRLGPATRSAIEWAPVGETLAALCSEQAGFYRVLVARKPALAAFSSGWEQRAYWRPDA